jgi:SAM-dependent methyltransferase
MTGPVPKQSTTDQYRSQAAGWTDTAYADAGAYLAHRADLVLGLGPPLEPGDLVLDLACGDGGLGAALVTRGMRYHGVDATAEMVDAARGRLGAGAPVELGDLNVFAPAEPVAATTVFRAIYYAHDRRAFFARVAGYTSRKLVFDLNPRQYRVADVTADLRAAGFDTIVLHPFFVPQTMALPRPLGWLLRMLERSGPLARAALRFRFTYVVAASRS